ncbi:MAG: hypothetical protein KGN77_02890 [Xanthomonadaceae bacterium]|nr:hypothetical protein [Xanthomonadaceae bacterium]MDE1964652.1 hypothetical protein [Xanthomonadaceae bacterium]
MHFLRPSTLLLAVAALLGGCASQPGRAPDARPAAATAAHAARSHRPQPPPSRTGIVACDEYLASYRACHRAAAIFPPDQIETRYREMRQSLLRDAADPRVRPQLAARCNALARSLREALHGKSCGAVAAPTLGSGT